MSKRFIDTEIFNDSWFMDLSVNAKLLYIYFITNCDHAGIIDINWKLAELQTGIKQLAKSYESLIKEFDNRVISLINNYLFIPRFITFQYPGFPKSQVRQQAGAIKRLSEFNLFDIEKQSLNKEFINSYVYEYGNGTGNEDEKKRGKTLFKNSGVTKQDIIDAFAKADDLKNADAEYYYNCLEDSSSKNYMYIDWIATARSWARKDLKNGQIKLKGKKAGTIDNQDRTGVPMTQAQVKEYYEKHGKYPNQ